MTDNKYKILEVLYNSSGRTIGRIELLNKFAPDGINQATYAIDELIFSDYIKSTHDRRNVNLTPKGANAYESEKEKRYYDAQQKRQQRFDNKVSVANVFIPMITFFLGVIVEHCTQIIDSIIAFLK